MTLPGKVAGDLMGGLLERHVIPPNICYLYAFIPRSSEPFVSFDMDVETDGLYTDLPFVLFGSATRLRSISNLAATRCLSA